MNIILEDLRAHLLNLGFEQPFSANEMYTIVSTVPRIEEGILFTVKIFQPVKTVWIQIYSNGTFTNPGYLYQGRVRTIDDINNLFKMLNIINPDEL